ncbi:head-tail joining protein [Azospirillum doebereinerae]|uniref:Head-tail adaptor protein n=1 Tax=Azospirillum doebereinerae TaxID=92933 RepID=A0A3S0X6K2_9PROT|nr:hypothetical protein [Azospirillum doebereinerae]RUQ60611.1 hypothetical protein EJ913_30485 [Azospirillum doebereinerae]
MTVFDSLFDTLFADPNMASSAVYTPPGGSPVACRVSFRQPDVDWRSDGSGVSTTSRIAEVRVSEVAVMEEEGTLAIGGQTFTIQKASRPDADRLLWRLELR